mmetsp:Transcript_18555/g.48157  ORF Transcript_18555/g.48157 Transcript_18555/m.48157 type:complete len:279 (-) Transcript_18555:78-914(-)
MASAQSMRATERDDLLVVEAHAVEDVPEVSGVLLVGAVVGTRQPAVWRHVAWAHGVHAAGAPGHLGAAEGPDGHDATEGVEVCVADARVGLLQGLQPGDGLVEARIPSVGELLPEADRALAGAPGLRHLLVGAGGVPREAHEGGALVDISLDQLRQIRPRLAHGIRRDLLGGERLLPAASERQARGGEAQQHAAASGAPRAGRGGGALRARRRPGALASRMCREGRRRRGQGDGQGRGSTQACGCTLPMGNGRECATVCCDPGPCLRTRREADKGAVD